MPRVPSYQGAGLVNLVAELEARLTGSSESPGLDDDLSASIPEADSYVLVLFDGLGVAQVGHPGAFAFARSMSGILQAPFPTTTSVSLATVATGLPPSQHGQVAHLVWMPDLDLVVNSLKWVRPTGEHVPYNYPGVLPGPNLWERLRSSGIEPITVQPGDFAGSPLTGVLYRGARFEGAFDVDDLVTATCQLAAEPGRFVFTYVPHVDFAAHVWGLESDEFTEAMRVAVSVWEGLTSKMPANVGLVGTADHGMLEFTEDQKILVRDRRYDALRLAGDSRGLQMWGDRALMAELHDLGGGELADPSLLIGPDPLTETLSRLGDKVLLPPADRALIPRGFDKRLRCYHGGLSNEEVEIPLLVG